MRRPRRGGIHTPWQDAQLKEAEELLNNLTGAADLTTAEIQRTLRAPRLDALPPRSQWFCSSEADGVRLGASGGGASGVGASGDHHTWL